MCGGEDIKMFNKFDIVLLFSVHKYTTIFIIYKFILFFFVKIL